jgi:hypothetical protein
LLGNPRTSLQQADCWYHFSSSMGIKTGMRMINKFSG